MFDGLSQILGDSAAELPDNLQELEARHCQFFQTFFFLGHKDDLRPITPYTKKVSHKGSTYIIQEGLWINIISECITIIYKYL